MLNENLRSVWTTAAMVALNLGYTFTSACMIQAGYGNGQQMQPEINSKIFNTIKTSSEFKRVTNAWIAEYKSTGNKNFYQAIEFKVNDVPDLYYSMQHVNVQGYVQNDGNMLITVSDTYNFDSFRKGLDAGAFGNNIGLLLQYAGAIDTFYIKIQGHLWAGTYTPPSSGETEKEVSRYTEYGVCYPQVTINFRSTPNSTSNSNIIGQYYVGESVNYDLVVRTNKYTYISWIGASTGTRRYMAVRDEKTGERWATIV